MVAKKNKYAMYAHIVMETAAAPAGVNEYCAEEGNAEEEVDKEDEEVEARAQVKDRDALETALQASIDRPSLHSRQRRHHSDTRPIARVAVRAHGWRSSGSGSGSDSGWAPTMPGTPMGFPSTGTIDYYHVDKAATLNPASNARHGTPAPASSSARRVSHAVRVYYGALALVPPFAFAPAYPTPRVDTEHRDAAMHRRGRWSGGRRIGGR